MTTASPESAANPIETLTEAECWSALASLDLGRLALRDGDDVDVFPVNYVVTDGSVYFRSAPGAKLVELTANPRVTFEADGESDGRRWSVMAKGHAERLSSDAEIESSGVHRLVSLSPTTKWNYVRITPTEIMGRRFVPVGGAAEHAGTAEVTLSAEHDSSLAETVVAGHDGSPASSASLEVAFDHASRLGAGMLVVRAWSVDTAPRGALIDHGYVASFEEVSAKVAAQLVEDTRSLVARHPNVPVQYRAKMGNAASVLIEASAGAMMLVVGSRGRGGFRSLMLGSVSEQAVHHALCPVLVVRPAKRA